MSVWAGREFVGIRRGDVTRLLDEIVANAGEVAADRVLGILSKLMNWYATRHDDYNSLPRENALPIIKATAGP